LEDFAPVPGELPGRWEGDVAKATSSNLLPQDLEFGIADAHPAMKSHVEEHY